MRIAILAALASVAVSGPGLAADYKFNLTTGKATYTFFADTSNEQFEFLGFDYGVSNPYFVDDQESVGQDISTFVGSDIGIANTGTFGSADRPFISDEIAFPFPSEDFIDGSYTGLFYANGSDVGSSATLDISSDAPTNPGTVSAAPEPSTWALMLGGIGLLGGMLRVASARRREDQVRGMAKA